MVNVFLLLGSNLGDRQQYLQQAVEYIEQEIAPVSKKSSIYETQSWGKSDAPDYLNQVVEIKTDLSAQEILQKALQIELLLGREREEKWASRTLDIDLLFYDLQIIDEPNLVVPHPQLHKRRFTMEPLVEIAPDFVHPVINKTLLAIKNGLDDDLIVKKL